jgi:branched-chain amino acid transport system ATP-binding protein
MTLSVSGLTAGYGASTVIHQLSLEVAPGEIVAILGPNGAGKTTLLRCLAGLLKPREGKVEFLGTDVTRMSTRQHIGAGVILCPESRQLFPNLTVLDNLRLGAMAAKQPLSDAGVDEVISVFKELRDALRQKAGTLSGGQQQMVAVARALVAHPKLLLLDEPSLGLAVGAISVLGSVLKDVRERDGLSLLIVEQNPLLPQSICDRFFTLTGGRLGEEQEADAMSGDLSSSFFDRALSERDRPETGASPEKGAASAT